MPPHRLDRVVNKVIVKVNGEPILLTDVLAKELEMMPLLRSQIPVEELEAQRPLLLRQFLLALIDEKVILQRAADLQIEITTNDIDRTVNLMQEQMGLTTDEAMMEALAREGLTISDFRAQVRRQLLVQRLIYEEVDRQIFVSEQEIEEFYSENGDQFGEPEQVGIRQIIFLVEGRERAAIEGEALAALAELRGGATMEAVATGYDGATLAGGRDAALIAVDQLMPEIAAATGELPVGAFSEPVESRYGLHLVQMLQRKAASLRTLEEVEDEIRERVLSEKRQSRIERYTNELRSQTLIKFYADEFRDVEEQLREETERTSPAGLIRRQ